MAEAAQKYEVWSAMEISKAHMRNAIPAHGFEVLVYAAKHDFWPLADEAAEYSILAPMTETVDRLGPKYLRAFAQYVDQHRSTVKSILAFQSFSHVHRPSGAIVPCVYWSLIGYTIQDYLRSFAGPWEKVLDRFIVTPEFDVPGKEISPCDLCFQDMLHWRARCQAELGNIKNMSTFFDDDI